MALLLCGFVALNVASWLHGFECSCFFFGFVALWLRGFVALWHLALWLHASWHLALWLNNVIFLWDGERRFERWWEAVRARRQDTDGITKVSMIHDSWSCIKYHESWLMTDDSWTRNQYIVQSKLYQWYIKCAHMVAMHALSLRARSPYAPNYPLTKLDHQCKSLLVPLDRLRAMRACIWWSDGCVEPLHGSIWISWHSMEVWNGKVMVKWDCEGYS